MNDNCIRAGDDVRITAGSFAGAYGKVDSQEPNGIATVAVRIEDREVVVKLPCEQLERLSR